MSRHRFTIELDVDDAELAKHDDRHAPPPADVDDWDPSDLVAADALGIIELRDAQVVDYEEVQEEDDDVQDYEAQREHEAEHGANAAGGPNG